MKEVIVKLLVSAGLGVACGFACKKINDEMEKWTQAKIRQQLTKDSNTQLNDYIEQLGKEMKGIIRNLPEPNGEKTRNKLKEIVERQQYIKENVELVRIHGLEKAEQIRWEQMNQPKED